MIPRFLIAVITVVSCAPELGVKLGVSISCRRRSKHSALNVENDTKKHDEKRWKVGEGKLDWCALLSRWLLPPSQAAGIRTMRNEESWAEWSWLEGRQGVQVLVSPWRHATREIVGNVLPTFRGQEGKLCQCKSSRPLVCRGSVKPSASHILRFENGRETVVRSGTLLSRKIEKRPVTIHSREIER